VRNHLLGIFIIPLGMPGGAFIMLGIPPPPIIF